MRFGILDAPDFWNAAARELVVLFSLSQLAVSSPVHFKQDYVSQRFGFSDSFLEHFGQVGVKHRFHNVEEESSSRAL